MTDRPNIEALAQEAKRQVALACREHNWFDAERAAFISIDALAAAQAAAVPQGWRLVPEEPTEAMYLAASAQCPITWPATASYIYRAMLFAAPPAPAPIEPSRAEKQRAAGYSPRKDNFKCEECGQDGLSVLGLQAHKCAPASPAPVAMPDLPLIAGFSYSADDVSERDATWRAECLTLSETVDALNAELAALRSAPIRSIRLTDERIEEIWEEQSGQEEMDVWNFARAIEKELRSAPTGAQPLTSNTQDAERYRWLREHSHPINGQDEIVDSYVGRWYGECINSAVDFFIDADEHGITGTPAADGEVTR